MTGDIVYPPAEAKSYIQRGQYYGYPVCCISDFIDRVERCDYEGLGLSFEQRAVHKNTGFIPCPGCAQKVATGQIQLKDLIVDRICPEPFPNGDTVPP